MIFRGAAKYHLQATLARIEHVSGPGRVSRLAKGTERREGNEIEKQMSALLLQLSALTHSERHAQTKELF